MEPHDLPRVPGKYDERQGSKWYDSVKCPGKFRSEQMDEL